jgi:hypothetical protein
LSPSLKTQYGDKFVHTFYFNLPAKQLGKKTPLAQWEGSNLKYGELKEMPVKDSDNKQA